MKTVYIQAIIILLIACSLLVCDRFYRINEGFYAAPPGAAQCGVDIPSCEGQPKMKCFNGYCQDTEPPRLPLGPGARLGMVCGIGLIEAMRNGSQPDHLPRD